MGSGLAITHRLTSSPLDSRAIARPLRLKQSEVTRCVIARPDPTFLELALVWSGGEAWATIGEGRRGEYFRIGKVS